MVRVSSKGNPWHDDLGRFCSKEAATCIKCGDKFVPCVQMTIEEKDALLKKVYSEDYAQFYSKQSDKRLAIAKEKSVFIPLPIPKDATPEERKKIYKKNMQLNKKALKEFAKENKYHLDHGGSFSQYIAPNGTIYFVCLNADRIVNETAKHGGASIDISTGMRAFDGYMVAKYPEKSLWIKGDTTREEKIEAVKKYLNDNMQQLSEKNMYFGTWYDSESGEISIDISEQCRTEKDAVKLGQERNEMAIWDTKQMCEISTGGTGSNR